jgi:hypothetical protein
MALGDEVARHFEADSPAPPGDEHFALRHEEVIKA